MTCKTQVLIGTTSREVSNFQKTLMPSKITLPLHRFIKKVLKIFQAHGNSIAIPLPPPPPPHTSPSEISSKWTSKQILPQRRLVAVQRKVRDDLHDSGMQWTAGTFKLRCLLCFPETRRFSVWNRAQLNECVKLYHFKTNERCHTPEELS